MKRVSRDAGLHEKTVQRIAYGKAGYVGAAVGAYARPRYARPVTVTRKSDGVHPAVWAEAMKLASGNAARITVISSTVVEVR